MPTWSAAAWSGWTPDSGGHTETVGQRLKRGPDALLPAVAYDACLSQADRVSSLSLVRYRTNDYSAPMAYGHRDVMVKGYVNEVVISCGSEIIARHPRSYQRDDFVYDPIHYLPLLEQKTAALGQAAPLQGGTCQRNLERCSVCWSPAWDGGASGGACRCSGCWKPSLGRRWLRQ